MLLGLLGCAGSEDHRPAGHAVIVQGHYVLEALDDEIIAGPRLPGLNVESETLSGNAGCNQFRGQYQSLSDGAIQVHGLAATRKLCRGGGVMAREGAVLLRLRTASHWRHDDTKLLLSGPNGKLRYKLVST